MFPHSYKRAIAILMAFAGVTPSLVGRTTERAAVAPSQVRGYNALEFVYAQMAPQLASRDGSDAAPMTLPAAIALCEKIHPDAAEITDRWVEPERRSYTYLRSICLNNVAISAKMPELCARVRLHTPSSGAPTPGRHGMTPATCRKDALTLNGPAGTAVYGQEMFLLLLGYTREEITEANSEGRAPEEGGAFEFLWTRMPVANNEEGFAIWDDFLERLERLPDFSGSDDAAARQLDLLEPAWNSLRNRSRLAEALRCAVPRIPLGERLSSACEARMGS